MLGHGKEIVLNAALGIMAFTGSETAHSQREIGEEINQNVAMQTMLKDTTVNNGYLSTGSMTYDTERLEKLRKDIIQLQEEERQKRELHNKDLQTVAVVVGTVGLAGLALQARTIINRLLPKTSI